MSDSFEPPNLGDVTISADAWAQISSHISQTPDRRARAEQVAQHRQRQVEQLIASGAPTRPVRSIRRLSPPFDGAEIVEIAAQYDGSLGTWWTDPHDGSRAVFTVEATDETIAQVSVSLFPGEVSHIAALPGRRWLGSCARADWSNDDTVPDHAWVIDETGAVLASGCLGDAHLRPVVTPDARIFVTYFDEHPNRGSAGAWRRNDEGDWTLIPGSVRPFESIDEYSAEDRFTAGYSGMTVFNDRLRVIGRHQSPTNVLEAYAFHTDGQRFWYVSYPDWYIDVWGPAGQEERVPSGDFKGVPLIAYGGRIARFSGDGADRDILSTPIGADGRLMREVVTRPDGSALNQGQITTWAHQLHYLDGLEWYMLDVFNPV